MSLWVCWAVLLISSSGSLGVHDVAMEGPGSVRAGSNLALVCRYRLDTAPLYSVKFYLADQEFYRYVPKESPATRVFPLPGVRVNVERSNASLVYLERVEKEVSGYYKCEVSDDAPYFQTIIRGTQVVVTEEPESDPELRLDKSKYALGERIRANCTSRSGFPAANLTIYINNHQVVNREGARLWLEVETERSGLESSRLELEAPALGHMFRESGRAKVSCRAHQFSLYSRTVSTIVFEDTPQLAHVLGTSYKGVERSASSPTEACLLLLLLTLLLHPR